MVTLALWDIEKVPTLKAGHLNQGKGKVNRETPPRTPEVDVSLFWMVQVWAGMNGHSIDIIGYIAR